MYLPNTIMLYNVWVSCFSYSRIWWFREFYHIDNYCSNHIHMFCQLCMNIMVNVLWYSIINEIPWFIGYIYSLSLFLIFFYHQCLFANSRYSKSKNQSWLIHVVWPSIMGMVPVMVQNIMITIKSLSNTLIL